MADFTYISFGAGLQSTALVMMSNLGLGGVPRADAAIFADCGDEPPWVYDIVEQVQRLSDIPVHVVDAGNLANDIMAVAAGTKDRCPKIPLFTHSTENPKGMLQRQCTRDYKIRPIQKLVRRLLGYDRGERVNHKTLCFLGITIDESDRMKDNPLKWVENRFPLIDACMNRQDCANILAERGWPVARKSSCIFCPYHSDDIFLDLKKNHPEQWARIVELDEAVRDFSKAGITDPCFLHRSRMPIKDVSLGANQLELFSMECEGGCFL